MSERWTFHFNNWIGSSTYGLRCCEVIDPQSQSRLPPDVPTTVLNYVGIRPIKRGSGVYTMSQVRRAYLAENPLPNTLPAGPTAISLLIRRGVERLCRVALPTVTAVRYEPGQLPPGAMYDSSAELQAHLAGLGINREQLHSKTYVHRYSYANISGYTAFVIVSPEGDLGRIEPGDWVVYEPDGIAVPYTNDEFARLYEVLGENLAAGSGVRRMIDLTDGESDDGTHAHP